MECMETQNTKDKFETIITENSHDRFIWLYFNNPINDVNDQPLALEHFIQLENVVQVRCH